MSSTAVPLNNQQRYKYGGGPLMIVYGIVAVALVLSAYDTMTSGNTEWHLFSKNLPIVIPKPVMVGFWWASLAFFGAATLISLLPAASVIVNEDGVRVQSPLTRNFKSMMFARMRHMEETKHQLFVYDADDRKITINRRFMSKGSYRDLLATIHAKTGMQ